MVFWTSLIVGCLGAASVYAANAAEKREVTGESLVARALPPGASDPITGAFSYLWTDGTGSVIFTNGNGGSYQITATANAGHWLGGKGWNPGAARSISFTADFRMSGSGNLGVYGWTTNPLVEYFVVEKYLLFNPSSGGKIVGKIVSDGSAYDVVTITRINTPSIVANSSNFTQVFSIRNSQRSSGTVTMANHINAWKSAGIPFGNFNFQIVAVEGVYSGGNVTVNITGQSIGTVTSTKASTSTVSSTSSGSTSRTTSQSMTGLYDNCSSMWGQCGGEGWIGGTCCWTGTCVLVNKWYSQCQ